VSTVPAGGCPHPCGSVACVPVTGAMHHAASRFRSSLGAFIFHAYEIDGLEHVALVHGDPTAVEEPLVRIQSSCLTGSTFLSELCDCRQQLHAALGRVVEDGAGVVLYLDQEGRSHGLVEKVAQLDLIAGGADTVEAARARGKDVDLRDYTDAVRILDELLGDRRVRMLTNNPTKLASIERAGIRVAQRLPLEVPPTDGNRDYLRVKKRRMGHLLEHV